MALLGLTFKAGTDDLRESPALRLGRALLARGAQVVVYDPLAGASGAAQLRGPGPGAGLPTPIRPRQGQAGRERGRCRAAAPHAVVVATEWPEFATLDWAALAPTMAGDVVVDGRRIVDAAAATAAGLRVVALGVELGARCRRPAARSSSLPAGPSAGRSGAARRRPAAAGQQDSGHEQPDERADDVDAHVHDPPGAVRDERLVPFVADRVERRQAHGQDGLADGRARTVRPGRRGTARRAAAKTAMCASARRGRSTAGVLADVQAALRREQEDEPHPGHGGQPADETAGWRADAWGRSPWQGDLDVAVTHPQREVAQPAHPGQRPRHGLGVAGRRARLAALRRPGAVRDAVGVQARRWWGTSPPRRRAGRTSRGAAGSARGSPPAGRR